MTARPATGPLTAKHFTLSTSADDALAELDVLVKFDDDLGGEATHLRNRIRHLAGVRLVVRLTTLR